MRLWGCVLMQSDWCSYRKRSFGQRDAHRENPVKMKAEISKRIDRSLFLLLIIKNPNKHRDWHKEWWQQPTPREWGRIWDWLSSLVGSKESNNSGSIKTVHGTNAHLWSLAEKVASTVKDPLKLRHWEAKRTARGTENQDLWVEGLMLMVGKLMKWSEWQGLEF